MKLNVASCLSDRIADEILESLSQSQHLLVQHLLLLLLFLYLHLPVPAPLHTAPPAPPPRCPSSSHSWKSSSSSFYPLTLHCQHLLLQPLLLQPLLLLLLLTPFSLSLPLTTCSLPYLLITSSSSSPPGRPPDQEDSTSGAAGGQAGDGGPRRGGAAGRGPGGPGHLHGGICVCLRVRVHVCAHACVFYPSSSPGSASL